MMEIWKDIEGTNGKYMVSNLGRVKNTKRGNFLKPRPKSDGYVGVHYYVNNKECNKTIHRLVAEHFLPIPKELEHLKGTQHLQVNHINEDKTDNRVENIEWCSAKYNSNYGTRIKRRIEKVNKPVLQFTKDGDFLAKYESAKDASIKLRGCESGRICDCLKGRTDLTYGYRWGYADDYERIPFKVFDLEIYNKKIV